MELSDTYGTHLRSHRMPQRPHGVLNTRLRMYMVSITVTRASHHWQAPQGPLA